MPGVIIRVWILIFSVLILTITHGYRLSNDLFPQDWGPGAPGPVQQGSSHSCLLTESTDMLPGPPGARDCSALEVGCKPCGHNFLFVWCLCGLAGKNTSANVRLSIHTLVYSPWQSQIPWYYCSSRFADVKAEALRSSATSSRHTSKGFISYCCCNILPQT